MPSLPTDSPAQRQFNEQYLGTLDGFPFESTGSVTVSADLRADTVSAKNVLAFDVTAAPQPVAISPTYANKKITIPPPPGQWLRGHRYAIALIGGPTGLRGAIDQPVVGSSTWALVSGRNALVTCFDLNANDCRPTVDVIHRARPTSRRGWRTRRPRQSSSSSSAAATRRSSMRSPRLRSRSIGPPFPSSGRSASWMRAR